VRCYWADGRAFEADAGVVVDGAVVRGWRGYSQVALSVRGCVVRVMAGGAMCISWYRVPTASGWQCRGSRRMSEWCQWRAEGG
jgi:hypothetical protein